MRRSGDDRVISRQISLRRAAEHAFPNIASGALRTVSKSGASASQMGRIRSEQQRYGIRGIPQCLAAAPGLLVVVGSIRGEVPEVQVRVPFGPIERWLASDDIDRAAGGIASVERSLRPLERLDALEI